MAQATFSVSFGAIHLDREQLSQFREGVHHNGYITGHLALVKMQDTGAGTADKFKIMGDNENDLSMLKLAGISVAMGNADPEIKKQVDYVTKSNEEDGVNYSLLQLLKSRRNLQK